MGTVTTELYIVGNERRYRAAIASSASDVCFALQGCSQSSIYTGLLGKLLNAKKR